MSNEFTIHLSVVQPITWHYLSAARQAFRKLCRQQPTPALTDLSGTLLEIATHVTNDLKGPIIYSLLGEHDPTWTTRRLPADGGQSIEERVKHYLIELLADDLSQHWREILENQEEH